VVIGVGLLGLLVGLLSGFMGAGGAIITVPALVYVAGIPVETAISTSLIMGAVIPITALLPRLRQGLVAWKAVAAVTVAGIPAAWGGTLVGTLLSAKVTLLIFAVLMIASGVQMLRKRPNPPEEGRTPRAWVLRALVVGVFVGFLTGLLGVGGGFITVPALVLALDIPIGTAIGTSLAIAILNSVAALLAHLGASAPDWGIAVVFAIPAAVASVVSAYFAGRVHHRVLQIAFAVLVFAVAAFTIVQAATS